MAQAQIIDLAERRKKMASQQQKKMEFKPVEFDIHEIPPDAPAGEWEASIPRNKCKVQPTNEHKLPMVIVPIRLDSTDEDGDEFQRALGAELAVFLVFGGKDARAEKMAKLNIRQFCEAINFDLDDLPKKITSEDDLQAFVKAIEGKKLKVWTTVQTRRDTGEEVTNIKFADPKALKSSKSDEDDDDDDDGDEDEKASKGKGKAKPVKGKKKR